MRNLIGCCMPDSGVGAFGSAERLIYLASDWSEHWHRHMMSIPMVVIFVDQNIEFNIGLNIGFQYWVEICIQY